MSVVVVIAVEAAAAAVVVVVVVVDRIGKIDVQNSGPQFPAQCTSTTASRTNYLVTITRVTQLVSNC